MKGEQNRDRAVERLLRETRADTVSSAPCVDAESLAAWREGTLPAAAARAVEAHASECARCQSMLAVFARAEPEPHVPAVPFWHRWRLQWLVPAAAMATALAVWVAVPRDRPARSALATFEIEQTPSPRVAAPVTGVDPAAPAEAPTVPSTARAQQQQQSQPRQGASGEAQLQRGQQGGVAADPRDQEIGAAAGGRPNVDGRLDKATSSLEETKGAREKAAAGQSAQPPDRVGSANAAESDARLEKDEASRGSPGGIRQRAFALPGPAAAPPASASAPAAAAVAGSSTGGAQSPPLRPDRVEATGVRAPFDVGSPDAVHRWRVDALGQVQHSSSAGAAWQAVSMAVSDVLTAGMSPGGSICWLVGRNGAVWLTADGVRFDRRPVAEPVDLISVRATDARHATLVAADGRTFVTTDGGVTWAPAAP